MKKIRVAIIAGGRSSEHPISCISASGVLAAIDRSKFEPILFGITQSGTWIDMRQSDFERGSDGLSYVPEGGEQLIVDIHGIKDSKGSDLGIDIAFPLLHGAYGEDGTIQGLFEMAGIAYVGSGVLASAVAMDKSFAKPIYADFGLKVADGITVHRDNWNKSKDLEIAKIRALGFPIFIKPARSGSSRGTSKVKDESAISAALDDAFNYDAMISIIVLFCVRWLGVLCFFTLKPNTLMVQLPLMFQQILQSQLLARLAKQLLPLLKHLVVRVWLELISF